MSADRAGLKLGELITAVDGKRTAGLTLSGVRRMLREGAPGTRVALTIGRGKTARVATLMLTGAEN
jgi:C-terminal processing protease CtpA/Prc